METIMKMVTTEENKKHLLMHKVNDYTLIAKFKSDGSFHEYVVCDGYNTETCSWHRGFYFHNHLDAALQYLEQLEVENYISKERITEIATIALNVLKENDFLDDFLYETELEDYEMEFFGVTKDKEIDDLEI